MSRDENERTDLILDRAPRRSHFRGNRMVFPDHILDSSYWDCNVNVWAVIEACSSTNDTDTLLRNLDLRDQNYTWLLEHWNHVKSGVFRLSEKGSCLSQDFGTEISICRWRIVLLPITPWQHIRTWLRNVVPQISFAVFPTIREVELPL